MEEIDRKDGTHEILFQKGNDIIDIQPFLLESKIPEEEHFYGNVAIEQTLIGMRIHLDLTINGVFDMDTKKVIPPRVYLEMIRRHNSGGV